ncbi:MAG: 16S rRNA (guanine(527)-N(7))-methyltransferase RsmG [Chloroflexi bacterium]|nr:16S rRNA (guanine(527)-N(7))-methyltransferase RsmG [Chloroflexota bacterium]
MEVLAAGAKSFGIVLSTHQLQQFQRYYEELVRWNKRVNLTSITGYEEVQIKHFLDSLSIATSELLSKGAWERETQVIDIGAGGGLPGLPLKIAFPNIRLTLIDSVGKKTKFLETVVSDLGLSGVHVLTGRAEQLGHDAIYREQFDLAVSRAVSKLSTLLEYCLPLVRVGGAFIAPKKGDISGELAAAQRAMTSLGGCLWSVKTIRLPGDTENRYLVAVKKQHPTPEIYPRRTGIPAKRPIE